MHGQQNIKISKFVRNVRSENLYRSCVLFYDNARSSDYKWSCVYDMEACDVMEVKTDSLLIAKIGWGGPTALFFFF